MKYQMVFLIIGFGIVSGFAGVGIFHILQVTDNIGFVCPK